MKKESEATVNQRFRFSLPFCSSSFEGKYMVVGM